MKDNKSSKTSAGASPTNAAPATVVDETTTSASIAVPPTGGMLVPTGGLFGDPDVSLPTIKLATKGSEAAENHGEGSIVSNMDDLLAAKGEGREFVPVTISSEFSTVVEQGEVPTIWKDRSEIPADFHQDWSRKDDGKYFVQHWEMGGLMKANPGECTGLPSMEDPDGESWYAFIFKAYKPHMGRNCHKQLYSNAKLSGQPYHHRIWELSAVDATGPNAKYVTTKVKPIGFTSESFKNWLEGTL